MFKKLILILILAGISFAQSFALSDANGKSFGSDKLWSWSINDADSGAISGGIIELNAFDGQLASYPAGYWLDITDQDSTVIIGILMQGKSENGSWVTVDTVLAADTLNAAHTDFTDLKGVLNFNTNLGVFPYYRPIINITSASGATCDVLFELYAYKKD